MGRPYIIRIGAQNGGVGKTVIAVNLALSLSKLDQRVLLVDGDYIDPSVSFYLNLKDVKVGVGDVIDGKAKLEDVILRYGNTSLFVVPGILQLPVPWKEGSIDALLSKLSKLDGYDFVIVDTPTGIYYNTALKFFDNALIVSSPTMRSVRMAFQLDAICRKVGLSSSLILNRTSNRGNELAPEEIEDAFGSRALAVIPEDHIIWKSEEKQIPAVILDKNSAFSKKMESLARLYVAKKAR